MPGATWAAWRGGQRWQDARLGLGPCGAVRASLRAGPAAAEPLYIADSHPPAPFYSRRGPFAFAWAPGALWRSRRLVSGRLPIRTGGGKAVGAQHRRGHLEGPRPPPLPTDLGVPTLASPPLLSFRPKFGLLHFAPACRVSYLKRLRPPPSSPAQPPPQGAWSHLPPAATSACDQESPQELRAFEQRSQDPQVADSKGGTHTRALDTKPDCFLTCQVELVSARKGGLLVLSARKKLLDWSQHPAVSPCRSRLGCHDHGPTEGSPGVTQGSCPAPTFQHRSGRSREPQAQEEPNSGLRLTTCAPTTPATTRKRLELLESGNRQLLGPAHGSPKGLAAPSAPPLPCLPTRLEPRF
uniref:Uncharacterized protein n=1 Tax=Rangifer tarandus platyrhynchus TaxID=3082113 RepID=A0ACB0EYG4_RANTA|nr:unnamed protein product [Rangifer tarandus platyrhynchus]